MLYFLTGHGSLPSFLLKINKLTSDRYEYDSYEPPLYDAYDNCSIIPFYFKYNHIITPKQNFLISITKSQLC